MTIIVKYQNVNKESAIKLIKIRLGHNKTIMVGQQSPQNVTKNNKKYRKIEPK